MVRTYFFGTGPGATERRAYYKALTSRIRNVLRFALARTSNARNSLDVFLIDSHFVRSGGFELASWYKKIKRKGQHSFNILAFPAPKDFPRPDIKGQFLGELYLNPEYIKSHHEDIDRMVIHGFLHLLGYDHDSKSDRIIMKSREQELWSKISLQGSTSAPKASKRLSRK